MELKDFIIIFIALLSALVWRFLVKRTESIAEKAAEKSLKKFQSQLEKELVRFQTKHQKQIDIIHQTFQIFQRLKSVVNYVIYGEKFTQQMSPEVELVHLIKYRHEFNEIYQQNHLLFPKHLCGKIDALIPVIDKFIETHEKGIRPFHAETEQNMVENKVNDSYKIVGFWSHEAFKETLSQFDQISKEIEIEFRKIYGTNEE